MQGSGATYLLDKIFSFEINFNTIWHNIWLIDTNKLFAMDSQHIHRRIYTPLYFKTQGFNMKQLILWIMIVLAFICVVSLGMIVINYTLQVRL